MIRTAFTEEQVAFRDSARRMAEKHVAPIAAVVDETDRFPRELVELFGETGLMQLWVPEKYGGPEGNLTMVCIAREEISRFSPPLARIAGLNTMFIVPLLRLGGEEQRQRFLPAIARGGVVTAMAMSEPQAGSDVSAMTTKAVRDGDSYAVNQRLIRALRTIWDDLADGPADKAVLLTGAGSWFSVGGDVMAMRERPGATC